MDSIPLTSPKAHSAKNKSKKDTEYLLNKDDDFAGLLISAGKSINVREMFVIWLWFLIIHSEIFVENFLTKFSGACDERMNMTMYGTIIASIIMIIGVIIIDMIYR